jgi:hypothetical protein
MDNVIAVILQMTAASVGKFCKQDAFTGLVGAPKQQSLGGVE